MHSLILMTLLALADKMVASPLPDVSLVLAERSSDETCINPENVAWNTDVKCPHTFAVNSKNQCVSGLNNAKDGGNYCIGYCETKNYWIPGPEAPFPNSACQAGDTCALTESKSTSVTNGWTVDFGFSSDAPKISDTAATASFNAGASYSYLTTTTYTVSETHNRPANSTSDCGYWTFVPFYLVSCGTTSTSSLKSYTDPVDNSIEAVCNTADITATSTTGCTKTPYTVSGVAQGEVVFVNSVCNGGGLMPMDKQDYIYQYPGVSAGKVQGQ